MSILFATTLHADCQAGAEVAARLAVALQVPLTLAHVSQDPRAAAFVGTAAQGVLAEETAGLAAEAQRLSALTGAIVQPRLLAGEAADALAGLAKAELAQLVVTVGSASESGLFGDTGERLVRQGESPVLTLHNPAPWLDWLQGRRKLRVLVGVDFGRASRVARQFTQLLRSAGPCAVTHCVVAESDGDAKTSLNLDLAHARLAQEQPAAVEVVRGNDVAAQLAGVASKIHADVILLGQRRSSLIAQLWHGSVSRDLASHAPALSRVIVPCRRSSVAAQNTPLRRIVVGMDFSEAAERAAELAIAAAAPQGEIDVVHVTSKADPAEQAVALRALQEWQTEIALLRPDLTLHVHVRSGDPAEVLLALAHQVGASALAIGSRSHSALYRVLLGSVAAQLVERSALPVLLAPLVED